MGIESHEVVCLMLSRPVQVQCLEPDLERGKPDSGFLPCMGLDYLIQPG
jgi:hypothetical protein